MEGIKKKMQNLKNQLETSLEKEAELLKDNKELKKTVSTVSFTIVLMKV